MNGGKPDPELLRAVWLASGIGAYFAASVALGLGLGWLVGHFIGGGIVAVLVGFFLGAIAGGAGVYRMAVRNLSAGRGNGGNAH